MNAVWLLLGLLVLAYTGSMLFAGRAIRGYGLPSGVEYVLLGFVIGPHGLGLAPRSAVSAFGPVAEVALGWLALLIGLNYATAADRTVTNGRLLMGLAAAAVTFGLVAGGAGLAAHALLGLRGLDLWVPSAAVGLVLSTTTHAAVRWVIERHSARGPISDLVHDMSGAGDAVPLVALSGLFALAPSEAGLHVAYRAALPIGGGVLLALVVALLLRHERRLHESWGVLLGVSLLGIGAATRLGLSTLSLMFVLGLTLARASSQREEIRTMVNQTERPVLLPVHVLAGATVSLDVASPLLLVGAVALAARVVSRVLFGGVLGAIGGAPRTVRRWLGLGTLSSGTVALSVGLACSSRLGPGVGDVALLVAAASLGLGEVLGPTSLRRALERAGEAAPATSRPGERRFEVLT